MKKLKSCSFSIVAVAALFVFTACAAGTTGTVARPEAASRPLTWIFWILGSLGVLFAVWVIGRHARLSEEETRRIENIQDDDAPAGLPLNANPTELDTYVRTRGIPKGTRIKYHYQLSFRGDPKNPLQGSAVEGEAWKEGSEWKFRFGKHTSDAKNRHKAAIAYAKDQLISRMAQ